MAYISVLFLLYIYVLAWHWWYPTSPTHSNKLSIYMVFGPFTWCRTTAHRVKRPILKDKPPNILLFVGIGKVFINSEPGGYLTPLGLISGDTPQFCEWIFQRILLRRGRECSIFRWLRILLRRGRECSIFRWLRSYLCEAVKGIQNRKL